MIDTHCHLDMEPLLSDLDRVLRRARDEGVRAVFSVGVDGRSCRRTLKIARSHDGVYAVLGIHPHNAKDAKDGVLEEIAKMAEDPLVIGWGEVGLDFYRNLSPRGIQKEVLRKQIALARRLGLPLVIHSRQAASETLRVLREEKAWEVGGIIHCFSDGWEEAKSYLDLGFFISVSGIITYPRAEGLREVVRRIPEERILVETDAPYLAPVPHRGEKNEPAFVRFTLQEIAAIKGREVGEMEEITERNARVAFRLIKDQEV